MAGIESYASSRQEETALLAKEDRTTAEDPINESSSRDLEHATTDFETFVHIIKGNIGTGILALPSAILYGGVLVGPIVLVVLAVIAVHCMHLLVTCAHIWCKKNRLSYASYGDIGEHCIELRFPGKGHVGRYTINLFLSVTQLGFCCIYILFVATNVQQIISQTTSFHLSMTIWILIVLPYFIAFAFIKNLDVLSWLSLVSNICMVAGFICIFYFIFRDIHNPVHLPSFGGFEKFALFLGIAIYAYEGIGLILPLENKMRQPAHFPWILNAGMILTTTMYIAVGFFGYLMCTKHCKGSITLNIGDEPLAESVKALFTLAIFLTYFLQMYVPLDILEPWFLNNFKKGDVLVRSFFFRAALVAITGSIAMLIPHLDIIIGLVGSMCSSALALTFPALFHSISAPDSSRLVHGKNIAIAILGVVAGIFGSVLSIKELVNRY